MQPTSPYRNFIEMLDLLIVTARDKLDAIQRFDDDLTAVDIQVRESLEGALARHDSRIAQMLQGLHNRYGASRLEARSSPPPVEQRYQNPRFIARHEPHQQQPPPSPGQQQYVNGGPHAWQD